MGSYRLLLAFGYIFLLWGIFDIVYKTSKYGFRELDFVWFCSITLFVLALGIIFKNSMLLNSFLSIAILVQPAWILDYIWISFFNVPLNGLSSYAFQSTYGILEFINSTRHLLMLPVGLLAVFMLSKKDRRSYIFIPIFITLLLAFSFLFTPEYSNINCVFSSCVDVMNDLSGMTYLTVFLLATIILSIFFNWIINWLLASMEDVREMPSYKNAVWAVFIVLIAISIATIVFASRLYADIPKYSCTESEKCDNCSVELICSYATTNQYSRIVLYKIANNGNDDYVCDIFMKILPSEVEYKRIAENSYIRANIVYKAGHALEYPKADSWIVLKPECKKYLGNLE